MNQDSIKIEVENAMHVRIGDRTYGMKINAGDKDIKVYPPRGIPIPQMANAQLKIAFQRNLNPVDLKVGEIGLIPDVKGCEAIILHFRSKDGNSHIQIIHNTASNLLPDDALFKAMIQRKGGDRRAFPELKLLFNLNLEFVSQSKVEGYLQDIKTPIFDNVFIVAPLPSNIGNILEHYSANKVTSIKTNVEINRAAGPLAFVGFNLWVYHDGNKLQYIIQYEDIGKEIYGEFNLIPSEM